ncbi:MAG: sigma-54 dependent transcriptional regulator [Proteobacteria bacterium]|nr:sigma-54 dependent transcriptional regulator [Cystobacterineae bacterium]MCL2258595.1 sigma-54 dependent transcriptional regulator [Cystobacterineae bacterium]MCL2314969.1 sigma-54 dependent transcriptional regulator [Pseudomonadota bacterium]
MQAERPRRARILVIDDEENARKALRTILLEEGFDVAEGADGEVGYRKLLEFAPDAVLCDVRMPNLDGISLLRRCRTEGVDTHFIMMTAFGSVQAAVEAMREGAENYLIKPLDVNTVLVVLEKALEKRALLRDRSLLRERLQERYRFKHIIGDSPELRSVFEMIRRAAPTRATVLILGESGTGKELVAHAIHEESPRCEKPFVKVNCAALSETLLESELFGHEKGSFTGALGRREGRFELAHDGTLFLDEIGDVSPALQIKLLRVLQQQEFERVGGMQTLKVDVRIVAATNKNLAEEVRQGRFRQDLFYRLNVVAVTLPPLRSRKSDISELVGHFVDKFSQMYGKKIGGVSASALNSLLAYDWPGNVRELGNVIERAVVLATNHSEIGLEDLPLTLRGPNRAGGVEGKAGVFIPGATLYEIEREAILGTLEMVGGSTARAAEILGISVRKIQYRLKEYASKTQEEAEALSRPLPI